MNVVAISILLAIHIFFIIFLFQINFTSADDIKSSKLHPQNSKYFEKYTSSKACEVIGRPGDCNPESCGKSGKTCESRYTRFWDQQLQIDRTQKSCKCIQVSFLLNPLILNKIKTSLFNGA